MVFNLKVESSKPLFLINIFTIRNYFYEYIKHFYSHYQLIYNWLTIVQIIVEKKIKHFANRNEKKNNNYILCKQFDTK